MARSPTPRVLALHEPTQGVDVGAKATSSPTSSRIAHAGAVRPASPAWSTRTWPTCATRVHVVRDGVIIRTLEREASAHAVAAAVYDAPDVVA